MEIIRKIVSSIGVGNTVLIIGLSALTLLALASKALAVEQPTYCYEWGSALELTTANIGGVPISLGDWMVPFDTITVTFTTDNTVMGWNPVNVAPERHGALMDWIDTAITMQERYNFSFFAGRDEGGQIWLVSQFKSDVGEMGCLAHPLDMH